MTDPELAAIERHAREVEGFAIGEDGARALLFIAERRREGQVPSLREIAQRFGWSRPRAEGVMRRVAALGMVKEDARR